MNQKTRSSERQRGRPYDNGQQNLKSQILDSAEELFAQHGYAATSIRHIAGSVGVNPALVHYYFGNKEALLHEVMERSLEPLARAITAMKSNGDTSPASIAGLLLSMLAKHPNLPRLMTREVLLPGGVMQQYFTDNLAPNLGGALPALLSREKSQGRLRHDADPAISAVLIMAMCVFPYIARSLAEPVLGVRFDDHGLELLEQQITGLLQRGLML